jgi:hypothetical protein
MSYAGNQPQRRSTLKFEYSRTDQVYWRAPPIRPHRRSGPGGIEMDIIRRRLEISAISPWAQSAPRNQQDPPSNLNILELIPFIAYDVKTARNRLACTVQLLKFGLDAEIGVVFSFTTSSFVQIVSDILVPFFPRPPSFIEKINLNPFWS